MVPCPHVFMQNKHKYEMVLKTCGYKVKLIYKTMDETLDICNWRIDMTRKILWFIPLFSDKLEKEFLRLSKKNFPLLSILYKIFNKNNVKLNYSCMLNVENLINKSNTKKTQE